VKPDFLPVFSSWAVYLKLAFSSLLGFSSVFFRVGVAAGWVTRSEARHGQSTATEVSALRRALYP
jgi:hypothetical protein